MQFTYRYNNAIHPTTLSLDVTHVTEQPSQYILAHCTITRLSSPGIRDDQYTLNMKFYQVDYLNYYEDAYNEIYPTMQIIG